MAINGVRFGHVAFKVSDAERSIRWYADAFGARKVFHAKQEGERPELMFLEFAKGQFLEFFTNGKAAHCCLFTFDFAISCLLTAHGFHLYPQVKFTLT